MLDVFSDFDAKDWIQSAGALISFFASAFAVWLGLNNQKITKGIRLNTIGMDEFRSEVRGPVKGCIETLCERRLELRALARPSSRDVLDIAQDCQNLIPKLEVEVLKLREALEDADASSFSQFDDWARRFANPLSILIEELEIKTRGPSYVWGEISAKLVLIEAAISLVQKETKERFEADISEHSRKI